MSVTNLPKITLTEDDIDGASLQGKTFGPLTIPELKRRLSCRKGTKLNGTKRSLVERCGMFTVFKPTISRYCYQILT